MKKTTCAHLVFRTPLGTNGFAEYDLNENNVIEIELIDRTALITLSHGAKMLIYEIVEAHYVETTSARTIDDEPALPLNAPMETNY